LILIFQNFKILTVRAVMMVKLRNYAKFCGDRSNRWGDMVIFRFFQDVGCMAYGILCCAYLDHL